METMFEKAGTKCFLFVCLFSFLARRMMDVIGVLRGPLRVGNR